MKAAILFICCIVISQTQADVKENDYSDLCEQCKGSSLPKCEATDDGKLDRKVECQQEGCIIAMATDTDIDFMCVIAAEHSEVTKPESRGDSLQSTNLPLPLALQMATTTEISRDTSQESNGQADTSEASGIKANETDGAAEQVEGNEPVKVAMTENETEQNQESKYEQQQSANNEEESAEKINEAKPVETEMKPEQTDNADIADSAGEVTKVSESAVAAELEPETADKPNSPDYPADEPFMQDTDTKVDVAPPTVPALEPPHAVDNEPGKGGNTAIENSSAVHQILETNKNEGTPSNGEQGGVNGDTLTEHSDNSARESEGQAASADMHNANSDSATIVVNTEPAVVAMSPLTSTATTAVQFLTCYSCTSTTESRCAVGTGKTVNCSGMENKQNGCYTLYKADTNITTRGCISELTDGGLKYCMSNTKECIICYQQGCNNLLAPSDATKSNSKFSVWMAIASFMCLKFLL